MLTLKRALALIDAALSAAREQGLNVSVVVVDRGGRTIASARDDVASYFSTGAAEKKAVTSVNFGMATHKLQQIAQKDPVLLNAMSNDPALSSLPGGLPILIEGGVVAAVGIAGAHYTQDQAIAEKAMAILG